MATAQATLVLRHVRNLVAAEQSQRLAEVSARELLAVVDEEVQQLPERYRAAVVLCYLEGQTRDQAAQQLGWSLSTLQRRLEEASERLRRRLERRGVALSAGLLAAI